VRWQKIARLAIAIFVVVFAGIIFIAMRQRAGIPAPPADDGERVDPSATIEGGPGVHRNAKDGKLRYQIEFKKQLFYAKEGRTRLRGVTLTLPDKDGRTFTVTADNADVLAPPGSSNEMANAKLTGNVRLRTDDGLEVTSAEALHDGKEGRITVPGHAQFSRGRMKGDGDNVTYDKNRDLLLLGANAHVTVAPDAAGAGAVDARAARGEFARADNYVKLIENARIESDGRVAEASEITILLDQTGENIQQLQLREQSRITGKGAGTQSMTARHIDLSYAPDGRTLQTSKLMENAVVELPASTGAAGPRIAGNTIDIGMSPDGATVTSLNASEKVQVDLPAEGQTPAKQIRANTLRATGAPGQGLQNAVFEESVEYSEARPASGKTPAGERTARSQRLIVDTKPGLGPVERADFRGNAKFGDGDLTAEAPRALYTIDRDQLDLSPSQGDVGPGPIVTNRQLSVQARNIHVSPSTQKLNADTDVRSLIKPQPKPAAGRGSQGRGATPAEPGQTRMPVMLKQDKPVTITSNRVEYDGVSEATYTGNALLWQDQSRITADSILLNDRTGNLTARVNVRTTMWMQEEDPKTKVKKPSETKGTADELVYDDAKRLATYTSSGKTPARLSTINGDIDGDRIDLFLRESGDELDRAEADSRVAVRLPTLYATGKHMVYTASTNTYVLTGEPVVSIKKEEDGTCKKTEGSTLTYQRSTEDIRVVAMPGLAAISKPLDACPAELRH
jgi:lipopolysaccharide export system protein LptA